MVIIGVCRQRMGGYKENRAEKRKGNYGGKKDETDTKDGRGTKNGV